MKEILKIAFLLSPQINVKKDIRLLKSTFFNFGFTYLQAVYMFSKLLYDNLWAYNKKYLTIISNADPRMYLITSIFREFLSNLLFRTYFALAAMLIGAAIFKIFAFKKLTFKECIKLSNINMIPIWILSSVSAFINFAFMETVIFFAIVRVIILLVQNRKNKSDTPLQ